MRSTATTLLLGLLISLPAAAQEATPPTTAAPASTTNATTPSATTETKPTVATKLLSEPSSPKGVVLSSNESPLVAAARRANAARKANANKAKIWKIDDSMVGHNKGAATTSAASDAQLPQQGNVPGSGSAATMTSQPGMNAKERAEKVENLKREQQTMAAETDEPYGGDVDEDKATKRSTEIPGEIQKLNQPQPQQQQHPDSQ